MVLDNYGEIISLSSETNIGMEDAYSAIQQTFYGAEDLEND